MSTNKLLTLAMRSIASIILVVLIYHETGIFTALGFLLVIITSELQAFFNTMVADDLDSLSKHVFRDGCDKCMKIQEMFKDDKED
jgi:hypothetical protein